jgi:hypothetical protein
MDGALFVVQIEEDDHVPDPVPLGAAHRDSIPAQDGDEQVQCQSLLPGVEVRPSEPESVRIQARRELGSNDCSARRTSVTSTGSSALAGSVSHRTYGSDEGEVVGRGPLVRRLVGDPCELES